MRRTRERSLRASRTLYRGPIRAVIAVWDGEGRPGARGEPRKSSAYAEEQGVPLAWVPHQGPPGRSPASWGQPASRAQVVKAAADKLRVYNAARDRHAHSSTSAYTTCAKSSCRTWPGKYPSTRSACPGRRRPTGYSPTSPAPTSWPCVTKRRFRLLSRRIFALAAAAVAVVALQATISASSATWLAGFEVVFLGLPAAHPADEPPAGACTTSGSPAASWPSGSARATSWRWPEPVTKRNR